MPRRWGDNKPSYPPLCNNKSALGVALFPHWHLLGKPSLDVGFPYGVEGIFCLKGLENSVEREPLCIFWTVWKARNNVVFRDEVLFIQKLKSFFVNLL